VIEHPARVLHGLETGVQHPEAGQGRGGQQRGAARGGDHPAAPAEEGADAARDREALGPGEQLPGGPGLEGLPLEGVHRLLHAVHAHQVPDDPGGREDPGRTGLRDGGGDHRGPARGEARRGGEEVGEVAAARLPGGDHGVAQQRSGVGGEHGAERRLRQRRRCLGRAEQGAQRAQRRPLPGQAVDLEGTQQPGEAREGADHPGAQAHGARDLHGPHHVQEALGAAEVLDERRGAEPDGAQRHQPGVAAQQRPVGALRAEGEHPGAAGDAAEEQVHRDRRLPRRRLDDGAAVVRVELVGPLELDVLDDGALARAVAHPDLAEAAASSAPPSPAAAAGPLRRTVGVVLGDAHRRAPRKDSATAATMPAAARPVRA
jgi:hypothetical protein